MKTTGGATKSSTMKVLTRVWEEGIKHDYDLGLLPNEKTLQAAIYHRVLSESMGLNVFVEINKFMGRSDFIPDLIVANKDRHVEAVIELKLKSNEGIRYEDDCDKLVDWAKAGASGRCEDTLELDPASMEWRSKDEAPYLLDERTSWVFAAIGKYDCGALDNAKVFSHIKKAIEQGSGKQVPSISSFWLFSGIVQGDRGTQFQVKRGC